MLPAQCVLVFARPLQTKARALSNNLNTVLENFLLVVREGRRGGGGGGVLPYISSIGMCRPKGCRFQAFLV